MSAVVTFWLALGLIAYTYALYPLLLIFLGRVVRRPLLSQAGSRSLPFVSVLIAVYNEERIVLCKLANCRAIDYPADKIEFLFGSDGSQDGTDQLIRDHGGKNVHLVPFPRRRGKAAVLNDLASEARGTVLAFSDANSQFEPGAIQGLVGHFQNPRVGGVCGRLLLSRPGGDGGMAVANESLYWRYESFVKRLEGQLGILAAANGAIYAVRKALFQPLPTHRLTSDDLLVGARVLAQGFWVTFEPRAVARESVQGDIRDTLRRKVRVGEAAYSAIPNLAPLLLPRHGLVALMLWSHKLIRWAVPFLLLTLLLASVLLVRHWFYGLALLVQLAAYVAALAGFLLEPYHGLPRWLRSAPWVTYPYYFLGANFALLLGFVRSLTRRSSPTWARVGR